MCLLLAFSQRACSYFVNGVALRFLRTFGRHRVLAQYIPGHMHPSDYLSRFRKGRTDMESLWQVAGQAGVCVGNPLARPESLS